MSTNPYESGPFRQVCDMEGHLTAISDLSFALMLLSGSLSADEAAAVNRLAMLINEHADNAENIRGELWRITHPDGAKVEDVL